MTKLFLLAAGAGLAGAAVLVPGAAQAQDGRLPFTGPRIEAIVGYDHNRSGSTVDIDAARNLKQSIEGLTYGVGAGFDFATGETLRVGAEAELTDSSAKWDNNNGVPNTFNLGRVKADRDFYVGARIGVVTSPRTMLYAKAGYTNARYGLLGTNGSTVLDQRLDTDGYRLGAGLEYALDSNAFAKLEYRYSNYSRGEFDFDGRTPDSSRFSIDTDRHQVVAGVGLRF
ncbi:outer membrane protein [Novosphingobium piscinae]|uniref:Porin family protein n=1 Tax=Novosphingobium piscinae TaxID=1507448 RepID=A0A7X1KNS7_9SPHN|nr:porin family protein [Novosphingobium piscinae]MBC2667947.1 porin family protein [Novosphingobium piscinae]